MFCKELDLISLKKLSLERENQSLKNSLQETELALASAQQHCRHFENLSQDLENKLHGCQNEAQASHSHHEAFMKNVEALLDHQSLPVPHTENDILKALTALCTKEKSARKVICISHYYKTDCILIFQPVLSACSSGRWKWKAGWRR